MRMRRAFGAAMFERAAAIDATLLAVPNRVKSLVVQFQGHSS